MKNVQSIWTSVIKLKVIDSTVHWHGKPSSSDAHATVVATCKQIYQLIDIFYHGSEATAIGGWIALNGRLGNG